MRLRTARALQTVDDLSSDLQPHRYVWPRNELNEASEWTVSEYGYSRTLPESAEALQLDSRWPALFPSPICLVTTGDRECPALEKVVGASIVNRFPYVVALSFCRESLSSRHYARSRFMETLERSGEAAVQFLSPGDKLDRAMGAIANLPDERTGDRLAASGLPVRAGRTVRSAVFQDSYLVYEARLVKPGRDFEGAPIYSEPWTDVGSHRVYYLEISAIQLHEAIAAGRKQIQWRSLPVWQPTATAGVPEHRNLAMKGLAYEKPYTPHYAFPSKGTIGFESDEIQDGMAVKYLSPLAENQVEVDNDRARWPCFFPSSVGMITTWVEPGVPNVMPCGSTTVISRHPMVIAPCVSYAAINERYAPRATLSAIRNTGRFGCGVPFIDDVVLGAIKYCGNVSIRRNRDKVKDSGLDVGPSASAPVLKNLPVHFDCRVVGEVRLGTHIMFLGEVRGIHVRADVTPESPIEWCPWATVARP